MRELLRNRRFDVNFPIEVRFGKRDDIYLSPSYGRDSAFVAVHMYKGMPYLEYFDAMEAIFPQPPGQASLGENAHAQRGSELAALYPMWEKFHAVRRELDPPACF